MGEIAKEVVKYRCMQRVLFQHCDPAGIVFYPRYFEMINATVEQWFSDELHYSFAKMHVLEKVGVPTVAIETTFSAASFLEDQLGFVLQVTKIGQKSVDLTIEVDCEAEHRLTAKLTLVFVDLSQVRPISMPWSDEIRTAFMRFLQPA